MRSLEGKTPLAKPAPGGLLAYGYVENFWALLASGVYYKRQRQRLRVLLADRPRPGGLAPGILLRHSETTGTTSKDILFAAGASQKISPDVHSIHPEAKHRGAAQGVIVESGVSKAPHDIPVHLAVL